MRFIVLKKKRLMALLVLATLLIVVTFLNSNYYQPESLSSPSFSFVVMSDSQGNAINNQINERRFRQLLTEITASTTEPNFILFAGDMVWGEGNIKQPLARWKDIVDDYYPIKRVFPAMGNHEHDQAAFSSAFGHLPNNQLPGYQRTVYYFDYNNSRFIVLNSDRVDQKRRYILDDKQLAWLEKTLASSNKTHNFVMLHVPAYPIGAHYQQSLDANPEQRDTFWELIDKYDVTAVFNGHEHNYNRRVVDDSFGEYQNKTLQLTLGGAGGQLNNYVRDDRNVVVGPAAVYHYLTVEVAGARANFTVYDINNREIDAFTVIQ
ncbi:metallophosphoesterase [Peptococcaceae bacterium 1198_IL3148]